ncbi:MAG: helix-turn-helix transcriptional regulator [Bacteroidota bacterium]|jgi:transcriptional regulator with XRE-family HTH domain
MKIENNLIETEKKISDPTDYEGMIAEAMKNDIVIRAAARENSLRRQLSDKLEESRKKKGLSIQALAKLMKTSVPQVELVLHKVIGGRLTLTTIVRACDVLEVPFSFAVGCISTPRMEFVETLDRHGTRGDLHLYVEPPDSVTTELWWRYHVYQISQKGLGIKLYWGDATSREEAIERAKFEVGADAGN